MAIRTRKTRARVKARFINNAMMATLLGAIVSDGLENGRVVSGVGGQHNFVTQAFALPDARSIITLNSTRKARGTVQSNIRWSYGHTTIPRHERDIVVSEYGIADLRGKSDEAVIAAMLAIADSRFQPELLRAAKDAGKIAKSYEIPAAFRDNTPRAHREGARAARSSAVPVRHGFHAGRATPAVRARTPRGCDDRTAPAAGIHPACSRCAVGGRQTPPWRAWDSKSRKG